jgi:uncharacterized protein YjcR
MPLPAADDERRCTANSKQTGVRCGQWATPGRKVCRFHGGKAGPKKGNKNATKTGEFERLFFDTFTEDEMELVETVELDVAAMIDRELKLVMVRERRMLGLIEQVRDGWENEEVEVVQERRKTTPTSDAYAMTEASRTTKPRSKLDRLLAIEEALTRVQLQKSRLMDLKHRVSQDNKNSDKDGALKELSKIIGQSVEALRERGEAISE